MAWPVCRLVCLCQGMGSICAGILQVKLESIKHKERQITWTASAHFGFFCKVYRIEDCPADIVGRRVRGRGELGL